MHDTHLFQNILKYFREQEEENSLRLKKAHFSISEFGSLNKSHFLEHYSQAVNGTGFEGVEISIETIPFGPEFDITGLEFEGNERTKSEVRHS